MKSLSSNLAHHCGRAGRNARTIVWALREMNGHVDTLKASVTGPFAEVNILMFVQLLWALPVSSPHYQLAWLQ
jgi:hypothetical protein